MLYRLIVQCEIDSDPTEIIGAKEAIAEIFERIGCGVEYINVMPGNEE